MGKKIACLECGGRMAIVPIDKWCTLDGESDYKLVETRACTVCDEWEVVYQHVAGGRVNERGSAEEDSPAE